MIINRSVRQVSDFGQDEIFCAKCVPKQAPSQAAESLEGERAAKASKMTAEVRSATWTRAGCRNTTHVTFADVPLHCLLEAGSNNTTHFDISIQTYTLTSTSLPTCTSVAISVFLSLSMSTVFIHTSLCRRCEW